MTAKKLKSTIPIATSPITLEDLYGYGEKAESATPEIKDSQSTPLPLGSGVRYHAGKIQEQTDKYIAKYGMTGASRERVAYVRPQISPNFVGHPEKDAPKPIKVSDIPLATGKITFEDVYGIIDPEPIEPIEPKPRAEGFKSFMRGLFVNIGSTLKGPEIYKTGYELHLDKYADQLTSKVFDFVEGAINPQKLADPAISSAPHKLDRARFPTGWTAKNEEDFQDWYQKWSKITGIDSNPDDPRHKYDYRAAFLANAIPEISPEDDKYHWDSRFKEDDHPNRFVGGIDTKTGKPVGVTPLGSQVLTKPKDLLDEIFKGASAIGDVVMGIAEEAFPRNPETQDKFSNQIWEGLGGAIPFFFAPWAYAAKNPKKLAVLVNKLSKKTAVLKRPGQKGQIKKDFKNLVRAGVAAQGVLAGSGYSYDLASSYTDNEEEKLKFALTMGTLSISEAFPMLRFLGRLGKNDQKIISRALMHYADEFVQGGGYEAAQIGVKNLQGLGEPTGIVDALVESLKAGNLEGIVGSLLGTPGYVMSAARQRVMAKKLLSEVTPEIDKDSGVERENHRKQLIELGFSKEVSESLLAGEKSVEEVVAENPQDVEMPTRIEEVKAVLESAKTTTAIPEDAKRTEEQQAQLNKSINQDSVLETPISLPDSNKKLNTEEDVINFFAEFVELSPQKQVENRSDAMRALLVEGKHRWKRIQEGYRFERADRAEAQRAELNRLLEKYKVEGLSQDEAFQKAQRESLKEQKGELDVAASKIDYRLIDDAVWKAYRQDIQKKVDSLDIFEINNIMEAIKHLEEGRTIQHLRNFEIKKLEVVFGRDWAKLVEPQKLGVKALHNVMDITGGWKLLRTIWDHSSIGRQGILLSVAYPKQALRAFKVHVDGIFSQDKYNESLRKEIISDSDYSLSKHLQLYIAPSADARASAGHTQFDEAFLTRYLSYIPGARIAERAFNGYLNHLRYQVFKDMVNKHKELETLSAEQKGKPVPTFNIKDMNAIGSEFFKSKKKAIGREADLEKLVRVINYSTMRGGFDTRTKSGRTAEAWITYLNIPFFSPRAVISRLQLVKEGVTMVRDADTGKIRWSQGSGNREAVRVLGTYFGMYSLLISLYYASGGDVEMDPRSSDFMKFKTGNTRRDFSAGFGPLVRLAVQSVLWSANLVLPEEFEIPEQKHLATGEMKRKSIWASTMTFLTTKQSPAASFTVSALKGTTWDYGEFIPIGDETTARAIGDTLISMGWEPHIANVIAQTGEIALRDFLPIISEQAVESLIADGPLNALLSTSTEFVGFNTQTFDPSNVRTPVKERKASQQRRLFLSANKARQEKRDKRMRMQR